MALGNLGIMSCFSMGKFKALWVRSWASLVVDIFEKTSATEQTYNVSAVKNIHAAARSVFILERANLNDGFKDNKVHYGQQVRIKINPLLIDKPVYLYSEPQSHNKYSKVSRLQEVVFMLKNNFNTIWIL